MLLFPPRFTVERVVSTHNNNAPTRRHRCSVVAQPRTRNTLDSVLYLSRGGDLATVADAIGSTLTEAAKTAASEALQGQQQGGNNNINNLIGSVLLGLKSSISNGPKGDALFLLATTAINTPLCQKIGLSPILGFLMLGIVLGPNGLQLVKDVHGTEHLADIGIVFFLFEMGIHLSFKTLMRMRKTVFGLGGSQFALTAILLALFASLVGGLSPAAATIVGGGLALSSSAFVLQLLKDKQQLGTSYGEASFGVLLLQDLMVVPLLVITPILAGTGGSLGHALLKALLQLVLALSVIGIVGAFLLTPLFDFVVASQSQEALVGLTMLTVLGMSFLTEGLGLSNTLGPFLAGVLLAENKHVHAIEHEASPIRGILVGLFFFTVGFEIDVGLIASNLPRIVGLVVGLLVLKTVVAASLGQNLFGLEGGTARRLGLVLSQGGEFAFVAFKTARSFGLLTEEQTQILLTVVSLTMACTPTLENWGESIMIRTTKTTTTMPPSGHDDEEHKVTSMSQAGEEEYIVTAMPQEFSTSRPEQETNGSAGLDIPKPQQEELPQPENILETTTTTTTTTKDKNI